MASLFVREEDYWSRTLRLFGASLGRFIYMVDAACDYDADTRKHSYNPVLLMGRQPEDMRDVLTLLLGDASAAFESLPIVSDATSFTRGFGKATTNPSTAAPKSRRSTAATQPKSAGMIPR